MYTPRIHPGNIVNDNTLTFAPLDEGEEYNLRPYLDEHAEKGWLLGPYVTVAKKFVLSLVELDFGKDSDIGILHICVCMVKEYPHRYTRHYMG